MNYYLYACGLSSSVVSGIENLRTGEERHYIIALLSAYLRNVYWPVSESRCWSYCCYCCITYNHINHTAIEQPSV